MRDWADELVARARAEGVELTGENGLLTALVRQVLQTGRVSTDSSGQLKPVTFTIPRTTSVFYWWADVSENGHFDSWSNSVECASL
jgi:hypothetical protein